jgi:transposase-like protein
MYQLTCRSCQFSHDNARNRNWVPYDESYNPRQRYLCPDCGYAWTDRPSARWERLALAGAGHVFALAVGLAAITAGWSPWAVVGIVAVAYGVVVVTEKVRSAVEDWLDPADTADRRA